MRHHPTGERHLRDSGRICDTCLITHDDCIMKSLFCWISTVNPAFLGIINRYCMTSLISSLSSTFLTLLAPCGLRRYSSKSNHTNPYAREDPTWRGDRAETHNRSAGQTTGGEDAMARVPWRGWQGESWRGIESIPMGLISTRPGSPSWRHDLSEWRIYLWH